MSLQSGVCSAIPCVCLSSERNKLSESVDMLSLLSLVKSIQSGTVSSEPSLCFKPSFLDDLLTESSSTLLHLEVEEESLSECESVELEEESPSGSESVELEESPLSALPCSE